MLAIKTLLQSRCDSDHHIKPMGEIMSYVYRNATSMVGEKVPGSGQCVELVRSMKSYMVFVATIFGAFFALARAEAKELILVCPGEIPAASIHDIEIQPGWRILNPNRLKLHSASFMGGSPEKMMDLVPFEMSRNRASAVERWKFDGDEVWLRCAYGAAGQITLSKKIDGKQVECSITYDRDSPSRIVCVDG